MKSDQINKTISIYTWSSIRKINMLNQIYNNENKRVRQIILNHFKCFISRATSWKFVLTAFVGNKRQFAGLNWLFGH